MGDLPDCCNLFERPPFALNQISQTLAIDSVRKTAVISIRTDPDLKQALEWIAAEDHRSLAGLVEKTLSDFARERGWYQPKMPKMPKTPARTSRVPEKASHTPVSL